MSLLPRIVRRSLLGSLRVSLWTLLSLGTLASLAAMFTTVATDTGRKLRSSLRTVGANAVAYASTTAGLRSALAKNAGVDACLIEARVATVEGRPVAVLAADPPALARATTYWAVHGRRVAGPGEILVGARLAAALRVAPGGALDLGLDGARVRLGMAGVFESGDEDESRLFVSPAEPSLARSPIRGSYALLILPGGETSLRELEPRLAADGVALRPLRQILQGEEAVIAKVNLLSAVALVAVLVLCALGVSAAVLARIGERRAELALMRAIGAARAGIARLLLVEAAVLGLSAAALGFVAGSLLAWLVAWKVFGTGVTPRPAALAAAVLVACGVALLSGAAGLRRALRLDPAAALQGE